MQQYFSFCIEFDIGCFFKVQKINEANKMSKAIGLEKLTFDAKDHHIF